jgi:RNA polymerase sigma-70 factor (ECF subfamily)
MTTPPAPPVDADPFAIELDTHRRYLLRVARLQLRDGDLAEDVVQETLLAAVAGRTGFSGRSSIRTWLTGILKHKIVDAIRHKQRRPSVVSLSDAMLDADVPDEMFTAEGAWKVAPSDWGNPETALAQSEFMEVLARCLDKLPPATARVFTMREILELDTHEICKELSITANNVWVILHRARVSLRQCLEQNWFAAALRR